MDKLVAFVPVDDRERLLDALAAAGAGGIGNYDRCGWWATGTGTFRPLDGARPAIGHVGAAEQVAEDRLEMVLPRRARAAVIEALRAAHPYEEPAFDVFELATLPAADAGARGLGRIGDLPAAQPLGEFVERVAAVLPRTAWGVRATGEGDRLVRRIAVCGGSGGELAGPAAALGADVLLTSDARHHYTLDSLAARPLAIVDAAHWATEHPWLSQVKQLLHTRLPVAGSPETRVDPPAATVSDLVTDPWRLHSC